MGILLERKKRFYRGEMMQPLAYALWSMGKNPFTAESVEKYMKKMAWEFRISEKKVSGETVTGLFAGGIVFTAGGMSYVVNLLFQMPIMQAFPLCSLIMFISIVLNIGFNYLKDEESPFLEFLATILFFLGGGGIAFVAISFFGPKTKEWKALALGRYDKSKIPSFVIETIGKIETRCPKVAFAILELEKDPLLRVRLGEEEYYVEAWSKPNSKGKQIA